MQPTGVLETAKANPLKELLSFGQSMWLDYIRRDLLTTGKLKQMIENDGLRGMTSNPSIFEKAIGDSSLYDDMLKSLSSRNDLDSTGRYELLAIRDIQDAADTLRPVYESSKFRDGYVSLEVSPYLARKTKETIAEAQRLWKSVNRENVMIKVPGTAEGLPAIRQLIGEGININVTLLFAQDVYEKVAEAYIAGLEDLAARGGNLKKMASVASFFISRIDTLVDSKIEEKLKGTTDPTTADAVKEPAGQDRHRERQADVCELSENLQRSALGGAGSQGRADAARAVGQHQHQESSLSRCALRRRADWPRHG
jgi:transaldolase / glucose-6-phosphate isomerase